MFRPTWAPRPQARGAAAMALGLLMAGLCGCASPQALRQPNDPTLASLLEPGIARGFPGIAFLAETVDGRIRTAAAGMSDIARQTPLRTDDAFHLASITKTITAVAALRLVDQGRLSLDATLTTVLPLEVTRHVAHAEQITVRQLIDHSSGIYGTNNDPAYLDTIIGAHADPNLVWTAEDMVALADPSRVPPLAEPGLGHHYSDTNYILLSIIVARVSGRPFKDFVHEQIFNPLGMGSTYFYSDRLPVDPDAAAPTVRGYLIATPEIRAAVEINPMFQPVPGEARNGSPLLDTTLAAERLDGAGGVVSTLPDLARFARAFFDGRLLAPSSQALMTAVSADVANADIGRRRVWALRGIREPYGVLLFAEGDGPGGVNTIMAFNASSGDIYLGFVNIFGYFDEVDWMLDNVIAPLADSGRRDE